MHCYLGKKYIICNCILITAVAQTQVVSQRTITWPQHEGKPTARLFAQRQAGAAVLERFYSHGALRTSFGFYKCYICYCRTKNRAACFPLGSWIPLFLARPWLVSSGTFSACWLVQTPSCRWADIRMKEQKYSAVAWTYRLIFPEE